MRDGSYQGLRSILCSFAVACSIGLSGPALAEEARPFSSDKKGPMAGCLLVADLPAGMDQDQDGIGDECEQHLAESYAPVVFHSKKDPNLPSSVEWFLSKTSLWFRDDSCAPLEMTQLILAPDISALPEFTRTGCGGAVHSGGTRSSGKRVTFFIDDVDENLRKGGLDTKDWATYYHAYRNMLGGVTIQYWRFYPYNSGILFFGDHGGDWEGVHVILDEGLEPFETAFLGHRGITYKKWDDVKKYDKNHPLVLSEPGGHASSQLSESDLSSDNYIIQKTWMNGTDSGGLFNLGEKTKPMKGMEFIRYSGLWGRPSRFTWPSFLYYINSAYWGPAFNETGMCDGFIKAWCGGMKDPSEEECYPADVSK